MDFKPRGLRGFRGALGYAMDFKAGGCGMFGQFGEARGNSGGGFLNPNPVYALNNLISEANSVVG